MLRSPILLLLAIALVIALAGCQTIETGATRPPREDAQKETAAQTAELGVRGRAKGVVDTRGEDLRSQSFRGRDLQQSYYPHGIFAGCDCRGADFSRSDLAKADFRGADGREARFGRANLTRSFFDSARLQGADFTDANLVGAQLQGADLRDARLQRAWLTHADFRGARHLTAAQVAAAVWSPGSPPHLDAKLRDALVQGGRIEVRDPNAPFVKRGPNLTGAKLRYANFKTGNLRRSDLRHCDLTAADLRGADLRGADLRGAVLDRARLDGARLDGADLRGTVKLTPAQLRTARWDRPPRLDQQKR